jgi:hypothetical protein
MSIYKNAIDSIVLGVEDHKSKDPRRPISAVRNLVAGILLLIKHRLAEMSPAGSDEVLIKKHVLPVPDPSGGITWTGDGTKTVDVEEMKARCTSLGIKVDWKRVHNLIQHRNDIEHYFTAASPATLRGVMADSFPVIRDFLKFELEEDPLTALGHPTWVTLTSIADVYNREKAECSTNLAVTNWGSSEVLDALIEWNCLKCGSGLIDVLNPGADKWSSQFQCRSCGKKYDFETAVDKAVHDYYSTENFMEVKDGGEGVTTDCPECSHATYHLAMDCCLLCGESVPRICDICGNKIPASELSTKAVCGWCNHMMSKAD